MSVNSTENKGLLWQLLSKHPNQNKEPKKFQAVLEYRVAEMHKNRFKFGNNLMMMNKEIIKQFAKEMPKHQPKQQVNKTAQLSKTELFEKNLKVQQNNFDTMINKQKPEEIDFSDKTDETPIDARMVDSTLQAREQELKNIMSQYDQNNNAKEWLSSESTSTAKHLKIDNTSNIKIQPTVLTETVGEKRVRFQVEESSATINNATSFLEKLKKTNDEGDTDVLSYLKRIEHNQNIIINLIKQRDLN